MQASSVARNRAFLVYSTCFPIFLKHKNTSVETTHTQHTHAHTRTHTTPVYVKSRSKSGSEDYIERMSVLFFYGYPWSQSVDKVKSCLLDIQTQRRYMTETFQRGKCRTVLFVFYRSWTKLMRLKMWTSISVFLTFGVNTPILCVGWHVKEAQTSSDLMFS